MKIIHVFADGSTADSVKGLMIPVGETAIYDVLKGIKERMI
jgi:hypothetical protein